jgi:hypothetical protein
MEPFKSEKPFIGMIHLPPLPGSPRYEGEPISSILTAALRDLDVLETGGADATIVENIGDAPFAKLAPRETITVMTVILQEIVKRSRIPVGVNVLRNDGLAALAIAAATGASFIRVNVFCGTAFTDQGVIEGEARPLLELRRRLGGKIKIFADIHVKHAAHLTTIEEAALDATRNHPDGLIVSGIGTGKRTPPEALQAVKQVSPLPVFVGSGVRIDNLFTYRDADGFIVGTALKENGAVEAPVDPERVRSLAEAIAGLRMDE